jgi:predicted NAD/FAD-dependent oxidoreductase
LFSRCKTRARGGHVFEVSVGNRAIERPAPLFCRCPKIYNSRDAICKHLAENLDVRTNMRVSPPTRCQGKWLVSDDAGNDLGRFDVVIVSAPGPQAGWRYALPAEPLPDRCLFDGDTNIGACGDWCSGPRVEGAFLSGAAVAERLLALEES